MNNLLQTECENIQEAIKMECEKALTLVTTKNGIPNGTSIIQTRLLNESGFAVVLTENLAKNLVEIYAQHQNNEIPFYLSGIITINNNKPTIYCKDIVISTDNDNSEQYACQHTNEEMTKTCNKASQYSAETPNSIPFVFVCHNHPMVTSNRKNNLQIINNISTQDIIVTEQLQYNARLNKYNGFSATLMINHIGDLNIIISQNGKCTKITDINFINTKNNKISPISEYNHPTLQNNKLGVFTNPDKNYDIQQTEEQINIVKDILNSQQLSL